MQEANLENINNKVNCFKKIMKILKKINQNLIFLNYAIFYDLFLIKYLSIIIQK